MTDDTSFGDARKTAVVNGRPMAYVDAGKGDPIVFQHGGTCSPCPWPRVMRHVEGRGRLIACDLIGTADADRSESEHSGSPYRYSYGEQRDHIFALWEQLGVGDNVVLVVHGWGAALGFDWANQHRDQVSGIVYMEAIVMPQTWGHRSGSAGDDLRACPSRAVEGLMAEKLIVKSGLPEAVVSDLSGEGVATYCASFAQDFQKPAPTAPRDVPVDTELETRDIAQVIEDYGSWLAQSPVPKLFIDSGQASILTGRAREFCRSWRNQHEVTVPGGDIMRGNHSEIIGAIVADFVSALRASR